MAGAKSHLLGLSKEIVWIPVQDHFPDHLNRDKLFRN